VPQLPLLQLGAPITPAHAVPLPTHVFATQQPPLPHVFRSQHG
jgi:hypothetical protein